MTDVDAIMDALADQIRDQLCGTVDPVIENLSVTGRLVAFPTVPHVDIYPADPFQEPSGFGRGNNWMWFTVRARMTTADNIGGQDRLLSLMDPQGGASMEQAIEQDRTLGGKVAKAAVVEGPSAYGMFTDPVIEGQAAVYVGCTWRVQVTP